MISENYIDPLSLPQAPSQSKADQDQSNAEQEKELEKEEQSERVLGFVPRFGTTDRMDAPPLTTAGKFPPLRQVRIRAFHRGSRGCPSGCESGGEQF